MQWRLRRSKLELGKPSLPRPQLDVVAFKPSTNEILVVECKSYLDSYGVRFEHFHGQDDAEKDVYKMFNRRRLREVVIATLIEQLRSEGLISSAKPTVRLVLVAGNIYAGSESKLRRLFADNGWSLVTPQEVADGLRAFADRGYENDLITLVTKLLRQRPAK
jgi:hypothetical protein